MADQEQSPVVEDGAAALDTDALNAQRPVLGAVAPEALYAALAAK